MMLSGITIVDFSQGEAGALSALRLGDLGANVIKVETGEGDWTRQCPPFMPGSEISAVFFGLNRGKRGIAVGPNPGAAAPVLQKLVQRADALITDRTVQELAEVGLAAVEDDPCILYPRLVVANISGLGEKGPMASKPASELQAQAMAGYTRSLGVLGEPARRLGADVASVATAAFTTQAILAALYWRNRSGQGQKISLSLWNSLLSMKTIHLAAQSNPDRFEGPRCATANGPVLRGYKTADTPISFAMGGVVGKQGRPGWVPFCQELGMDALIGDPRFDGTGRHDTGLGANAIALKGEYEKYFVNIPSKVIVEKVRKYGGIASEFVKHDELFESEQAKALELERRVPDGRGGEARIYAFPAHFSRSVLEHKGVAPGLGEHTREVVLEFGITEAELDQAVRNGGLVVSE